MAKRRDAGQSDAAAGVPEYLRRLDPDRYRAVAERLLAERPEDTFGAGMAVWRAWCGQRHAWRRSAGVSVGEWGRLAGGVGSPPFGWVAEQFGTPPCRFP